MLTNDLANAILDGAHRNHTDIRSVCDLPDDAFGLLKALAGDQWKGDDETWEQSMDRQRQAERINLHSRALRRVDSEFTAICVSPESTDVRAMAFERVHGRVEQFMLAGGGPTVYACFVFNPDGDGGERHSHSYLRYTGDHGEEVALIPQYKAEQMYAVLKDYK